MKTFQQFISEKETYNRRQLETQMNRGLNRPEFKLGAAQAGKGSHVTHSIIDPKGANVDVTDPKTKAPMTVGGTVKSSGKYTPSAMAKATNFNTMMRSMQSAIANVQSGVKAAAERIPGAENLKQFQQTMAASREFRKTNVLPSRSNVGQVGANVLRSIQRSAPKPSATPTVARMSTAYSNLVRDLPAQQKVELGNKVLSKLTGRTYTPGSGYRTDRGVGLADSYVPEQMTAPKLMTPGLDLRNTTQKQKEIKIEADLLPFNPKIGDRYKTSQLTPGTSYIPQSPKQPHFDARNPGQKLKDLQDRIKYYGGYPPKGPT